MTAYNEMKELVDNKEGYPEEYIAESIKATLIANDYKYEKGMMSIPGIQEILLQDDYGAATSIALAYSTVCKGRLLNLILDESNLRNDEILSFMMRGYMRTCFYATKGETSPTVIAFLMGILKAGEVSGTTLDCLYSYIQQGYENGTSPLLTYKLIANETSYACPFTEYKTLEEIRNELGSL